MTQVHYLRNGFLQCVLKCGKPLNGLEILVDVEDGRFSVLVERTHYTDALRFALVSNLLLSAI